MTIRGDEPSSLLIAVRKDMAQQIECLHFEKFYDGVYGTSAKPHDAFTRILIAKITLKKPVGILGATHVVMATHLHCNTAAERTNKSRLAAYWIRVAALIKIHKVDFLMGDFNMSLFKVVPELRKEKIRIECAAWYPWKAAEDGCAMADSCAIFVIDKAAQYQLLSLIHI